jgi:enoyl-CoA hydratase/carnithine racemase
MSPGIVTGLEERILAIAFARPDRRNAITSAMYTAMADAPDSTVDDANVRVVLPQGHETMFTAGNDIAEFRDADPSASRPAAAPLSHRPA